MQALEDLAIVLRVTLYQDRHRVITALTEGHGQISVLAKNAVQSRRFGGALELFTASSWNFTHTPGSEFYHLSEAHPKESFAGIRTRFEKLALASAFNEIMIKLAPLNEACPDLFRLHANALSTLATLAPSSESEMKLLNAYLAKILQWSGHQPAFQFCMQCQKSLNDVSSQQRVFCSVPDAGWICCQPDHSLIPVSPLALQDFLTSLRIPIRQIPVQAKASEEAHRELFRFLESLLIYHVPGFDRHPLKSLRFLELESNLPPGIGFQQ